MNAIEQIVESRLKKAFDQECLDILKGGIINDSLAFTDQMIDIYKAFERQQEVSPYAAASDVDDTVRALQEQYGQEFCEHKSETVVTAILKARYAQAINLSIGAQKIEEKIFLGEVISEAEEEVLALAVYHEKFKLEQAFQAILRA